MAALIRVLVVDDHADVRLALRSRLGSAPDLCVVGDVGDVEAALVMEEAFRPDVVLIEPKRADGRGLELIHWIARHYPLTAVVALTSYPSDWESWTAHRAGVAQYLLKDIGSTDLVAGIRAAAERVLGRPRAVLHPHGAD